MIRPVWLYRTIAFIAPFLSLAFALIVSKLFDDADKYYTKLLPYGIITIVGLVLLFSLVKQQLTFSYPWNVREAAKFIGEEAQAGEVIYVPHERVFWGFSWYFIGPGSVNPVTRNYFLTTRDDIKVISPAAIDNLSLDRPSYWLVYRDTDDIDPFEANRITKDFKGLSVEYIRPSQ